MLQENPLKEPIAYINKQVATVVLNHPDELLNPYMINIEGAQKSNMAYRKARFNTHHNGATLCPLMARQVL